jgi:hypothetical protein
MVSPVPEREGLLAIGKKSLYPFPYHPHRKEVAMRKLLVLLSVLFLSATVAMAAGPKSYQVTGPVLELKDDVIVVQKGKDKWEIARDKDTKVSGDLKVGSKVTIQYQMKATEIDAKGEATKGKK